LRLSYYLLIKSTLLLHIITLLIIIHSHQSYAKSSVIIIKMVLVLEIFVAGCLTILAYLALTLGVIWRAILYYVAQIVLVVLYLLCPWISYKILRKVLRLVRTIFRWVGIILRWMGTFLEWLWRIYSRRGEKEEQRHARFNVEVRFGDKWPLAGSILGWLRRVIFRKDEKMAHTPKVAGLKVTYDEDRWEMQLEGDMW
jgi:hypothetical protein